jgi:hypothetical protein
MSWVSFSPISDEEIEATKERMTAIFIARSGMIPLNEMFEYMRELKEQK